MVSIMSDHNILGTDPFSIMRGLDQSGTFKDAGGAGGIIGVKIGTNGSHFCAYDGNGNIVVLIDGSLGSRSGYYEYDAFGNTVSLAGVAAKGNPFRFSSQFTDDTANSVKYLHRDHRPSLGRWLSRDPAAGRQEMGSYLFCDNQPISRIDVSGLDFFDWVQREIKRFWDETCLELDIDGKFKVTDERTQPINGCVAFCCPVFPLGFAWAIQRQFNSNLPYHYSKKCADGTSCCWHVGYSIPWGIYSEFSIESGPHVGEIGTVLADGVDITQTLADLGLITVTTVKTTCLFSGTLRGDGTIYLSVGECK
jgi:RHS repeat-associated protein